MAIKFLSQAADSDYWDEKWEELSFDNSVRYAKYYKQYRIMKAFSNANKPIIEGGCGLSQWVYVMHQERYPIVGVDYAQNTVNRISSMHPELSVEYGDVFNLKYSSNFFGTYFSWGVVEHFESGPQPILKEAFRVLDQGGVLLISVPWLSPARRKAYKNLLHVGSGDFFQYAFSEEEFENMLVNAGFSVEKTYKLNWMKGYREVRKFYNGSKDILHQKREKELPNARPTERHAFIKHWAKIILIKISDLPILTRYFGHMILFVAKK